MSDIDRRLQEDKAMRDAAKRIVDADINLLRGDTRERSIGKRAAEGVTATSRTAADRALAYGKSNPLVVGGGIVASLLFLFRHTILDMLGDLWSRAKDEDAPSGPDHKLGELAERVRRSWRT